MGTEAKKLEDNVAFQEYVSECRRRVRDERERTAAEAIEVGHYQSCMLVRAGTHCTCPIHK